MNELQLLQINLFKVYLLWNVIKVKTKSDILTLHGDLLPGQILTTLMYTH